MLFRSAVLPEGCYLRSNKAGRVELAVHQPTYFAAEKAKTRAQQIADDPAFRRLMVGVVAEGSKIIAEEMADWSPEKLEAAVCAVEAAGTLAKTPAYRAELAGRLGPDIDRVWPMARAHAIKASEPTRGAASIDVSITRHGETHRLAVCDLQTPEELAERGLLQPWVAPDGAGFASLTPFELSQVRRLCGVTVGYCNDRADGSQASAEQAKA